MLRQRCQASQTSGFTIQLSFEHATTDHLSKDGSGDGAIGPVMRWTHSLSQMAHHRSRIFCNDCGVDLLCRPIPHGLLGDVMLNPSLQSEHLLRGLQRRWRLLKRRKNNLMTNNIYALHIFKIIQRHRIHCGWACLFHPFLVELVGWRLNDQSSCGILLDHNGS
jgi:hypothetical protein